METKLRFVAPFPLLLPGAAAEISDGP